MTLETQTAHKQRGNGARSFFPIAVAVYDSPMPSLLIENAEDECGIHLLTSCGYFSQRFVAAS